MAEALLRDALKDRSGISVSSAGIGALAGYPASEHSVTLMAELGLDISGHRARQLTPELIADANLVLVMETGHKRVIDELEPTARGKVHRLGEWHDLEIPDPHRKPRSAFEEALKKIEQGVNDWAKKIAKPEPERT